MMQMFSGPRKNQNYNESRKKVTIDYLFTDTPIPRYSDTLSQLKNMRFKQKRLRKKLILFY